MFDISGKHSLFIAVIFLQLYSAYGIGKIELNGPKGVQFVNADIRNVDIRLNGKRWLKLAEPWFIVKGQNCSISNGCLSFVRESTETGRDSWGNWNATNALLKTKNDYYFSIMVVQYNEINAIAFGQLYLNETLGTSNNNLEKTGSGFPAFSTNASEIELGYYAVRGYMYGDDEKVFGKWGPKMELDKGHKIGPISLFDKSGRTVVLSHLNSFMGQSIWHDGKTLNFGIGGRIKQVPRDYAAFSLLFFGGEDRGVRETLLEWGRLMRRRYNSENRMYAATDFVNNYLGYYTDDGACYYYYTEKNKTYEQTLIDVINDARKRRIPFRFIQLDSWFYPKHPDNAGGGTIDWYPHKKYFPQGLEHFINVTKLPVTCHGKWWSTKTPLAKQNGGPFDFYFEEKNGMALPIDPKFWDFILGRARQWGLIMYEQDWLGQMFDWMDVLQTNITIGEIYMRQFAEGSRKNGQVVHLATAYPRHVMAGLQFDVATEGRTSEDFALQNYQWRMGVTSIFAYAMGQKPTKDTFWTTPVQNCPHYAHLIGKYPDLEVAISTISGGVVGSGDQIGKTDREKLMKCCNDDGLVLKPERPAMAIDSMMLERAFKNGLGPRGTSEVTSTYSMVSGFFFGIIFAADLNTTYNITPESAGFGSDYPETVIYSYNNPQRTLPFSRNNPYGIRNCSLLNFCMFYTTPVFRVRNSKVLLLGEMTKWVPMSSKRFRSLSVMDSGIIMEVYGAPEEHVFISVKIDEQVFTIDCKLDLSGYGVFNLNTKSC